MTCTAGGWEAGLGREKISGGRGWRTREEQDLGCKNVRTGLNARLDVESEERTDLVSWCSSEGLFWVLRFSRPEEGEVH